MVDVESSNACVLDIQGRIECWGPSPAGPPPPVPDPTGSGRFVMVAAGPQGAACAVTRAARLLGERVAYGQQWRVPCARRTQQRGIRGVWARHALLHVVAERYRTLLVEFSYFESPRPPRHKRGLRS
jgi:hypothetical protein